VGNSDRALKTVVLRLSRAGQWPRTAVRGAGAPLGQTLTVVEGELNAVKQQKLGNFDSRNAKNRLWE